MNFDAIVTNVFHSIFYSSVGKIKLIVAMVQL